MADDQVAARRAGAGPARAITRCLRRRVEIDQHVAQEDHVAVPVSSRIGRLHQVQLGGSGPARAVPARCARLRRRSGRCPHRRRLSRSAAGTGSQLGQRVDRPLRDLQHPARDVGAEDGPVQPRIGRRRAAPAASPPTTPRRRWRRAALHSRNRDRPPGAARARASGRIMSSSRRKCAGSRKKSVLLVVIRSMICGSSSVQRAARRRARRSRRPASACPARSYALRRRDSIIAACESGSRMPVTSCTRPRNRSSCARRC